MVPAPFRSLRVLRVLNVFGVGLALAAVVSAIAAGLSKGDPSLTLGTGVPSLVLGTVWALLLRWRKTVGKTTFRWGWAASVPLAVLNSALAAGLVMAFDRARPSFDQFLVGALLGATFGIIVWLPALIATLLCFGAPIARAHRLAEKGLAGEERGERTVGFACTLVSLVALGLASTVDARSPEVLWAPFAFAALGLLTGGASTLLALAREARRRRFVADAEAGKLAGYRIDATDEGKVLVRVVSQGAGYRVADFEEEVFELGVEGEATRPKVMVADQP